MIRFPRSVWKATVASFQWHPGERPPQIEPHSKAKLEVLRHYLRAYFDRMAINPKREEIKLDLVDGFAGGGTFQDGDKVLSGSPLVMLEEAKAAEERLNKDRRKSRRINCKFYFIDKEKFHTDHLCKKLTERDYRIDEETITVQLGLFEDKVKSVIQSIQRRQPRAGRAIFLLDQTGFSQVELSLISLIFNELPKSEVILTFAADALINLLSQKPQFIKAMVPLQLSESQIHDLIQHKNGNGGRALVQRTLRDHTRIMTGATYDTPFFIRPDQSHRALWFLHLSRHPIARDVMIHQHWNIKNTFQHYGTGGFEMLGWKTLRNFDTIPLFRFGELDEQEMQKQLLNSLPEKLFSLANEQPIAIYKIRHIFANQTAARFSDLDKIVLQLVREREFDILDANGKARSRSLKILKPTDQITLPSTRLIPGLSRL